MRSVFPSLLALAIFNGSCGPWEALAEERPFSEAGLAAAGDYSASRNGHAFLVSWRGELVHERYDNDWTAERAHRLASGTKSFSGVLLAAAAKDGFLDPGERVAATIGEWEDDAVLTQITIAQLLQLVSGIDPGGIGRVPGYSEAVTATVLSPPGEMFRYGPNAFQVFGELVRRKLSKRPELGAGDPLEYLERRIFDPIGMEYGEWRRDSGGMPHLPSGAFLTAREWMKFGEFLRRGGQHDGEQLVDPAVFAKCLEGTDARPGYGITFWLLDDERNVPAWRRGGYMAAGAGKQRLIVLPAVDTVIVRFGESRRFEDAEWLDRLFGG